MRLDYDLLRDLLLTLESICDRQANYPISKIQEQHEDISYNTIKYHIHYLADAGFIIFSEGYIFDLTPKGHEFLNNVRNDDIWNKTKEVIKPLGSVALNVVSSVASSIISKLFNL